MKEIYTNEYFLSVFHNEEMRYIILKWKSFRISFLEIKEMHQQILEYAVNNNCEIFIADTAETTSMLSEEIIYWWRGVWIDELIRRGIKMIITIIPHNITAQLSTFEWQKGEYGKIIMSNVLSLEQAEMKITEFYNTGINGKK